jgi:hypothetical protein
LLVLFCEQALLHTGDFQAKGFVSLLVYVFNITKTESYIKRCRVSVNGTHVLNLILQSVWKWYSRFESHIAECLEMVLTF